MGAKGIITAACAFWLVAVFVACLKLLGYLAALSWGWIFAAAVPGLIIIAVFAAAIWLVGRAPD
jgi:hypothetical protein